MPQWVTVIPIIILGFIFVNGLINAINPRIMWKVFESWRATKEPTNTYFIARRITGIIAMIIVAGVFLFPHLMSK